MLVCKIFAQTQILFQKLLQCSLLQRRIYKDSKFSDFLNMTMSSFGTKSIIPPDELYNSIDCTQTWYNVNWLNIYKIIANKAGAINGKIVYGKKKNHKYKFYLDYMKQFNETVHKRNKFSQYYEDQLDNFVYNDFYELCRDFKCSPSPPQYFSSPIEYTLIDLNDQFETLLKKLMLSKVFSFDFEFSSLNVNGTHIEIAQISFSKMNNDKISNYIIYYRRLLSVESVQLKLQNEINKLKIDNLNKEINLAKKNKIEFYKLFLNKNIIKLGFGVTNDIDFLTKEIPYVVVEVENIKQTTLIDQWNQLVNNPIEHHLYDYQYKKNNQPIGLSDFVEINFHYPLDK